MITYEIAIQYEYNGCMLVDKFTRNVQTLRRKTCGSHHTGLPVYYSRSDNTLFSSPQNTTESIPVQDHVSLLLSNSINVILHQHFNKTNINYYIFHFI